jgi:tetratricopeptide (TPR) repeat protein
VVDKSITSSILRRIGNLKDEGPIEILIPTIEEAQQKVRDSPESLEANMILGELLYQDKRYEESVDPLTKASELMGTELKDPDKAKAEPTIDRYKISGVCYPEEMYRKITHNIMMMLGHAQIEIGSTSASIKWIKQALVIWQDDVDSWNMYGQVQSQSQDFEGAAHSFREALAINPSRKEIWQNLLTTYKNLQRQEAHVVSHILPQDWEIEGEIAILADLMIRGGNYTSARKLNNQLLEWNPNDPRGLRGLGRIAIIEGQLDSALELYEAALTVDPNDLISQWNLARVKCLSGNHKGAKKLLKQILKKEKEHQDSNTLILQYKNAQILLQCIDNRNSSNRFPVGVVVLLEHEFEVSDGKTESIETSNEIVYYAGLEVPLGSNVEEVLHMLHQGNPKRLTDDENYKRISVTWTKTDNRIRLTPSGLPGTGHEFKYTEPGSMVPFFIESSRDRRIMPSHDYNDIVVSKDVITFLHCDRITQERLQLAAMYGILKKQAQEKLRNWHW